MTQEEFQQLLNRLNHPLTVMAPTVRRDVTALLQILNAQGVKLQEVSEEFQGAADTVLALVKMFGGESGTVDVPHELIALIGPQDVLSTEDIEVDGKRVKRFTYRYTGLVT
jgi:hypothetical protein